jgi:hypothetical protein
VWDVITDNPELLEELSAIMWKDRNPFLSGEQAFKANYHELQAHMQAEINKWFEWLLDTPINHIGGELTLAGFDTVDWSHIATSSLSK